MPISRGPKTPEGQARSLANLVQYRDKMPREYHGVHQVALLQPQTRQLADQINAILSGDAGAYIRPADQVTVGLLAVALRRIKQAEEYLDKVGGLTNKQGQVRPVAELLVKLLKEARELCNTLGLTPQARARLGLNVARTSTDLAQLLAEEEVGAGGRGGEAGGPGAEMAGEPDQLR
jgi:hypothetical protein